MKQYTVYVCETCGYESRDVEDIRKHEASHLGLTVKEMESYRALKSFASYMGSVVAEKNNEETRKKFDEAVEKLIAFEKEHGIKDGKLIDTKSEKEKQKFTWGDKEDEELYRNGKTILWVAGRSKAIQKFVEALSYKIDSKCDFSFTAGRAHIDVAKDAASKALEAINDDEFMKQFIIPYSRETYDNDTYFEPLNMGP